MKKGLKIGLIIWGILMVFGLIGGLVGKKPSKSETQDETASEVAVSKSNPEDDPAYTGIWITRNFVDEFGDKTDDNYIANKDEVTGKFSNSAVKDEALRVKFIITKEDFGMQFYQDYFGLKNDVPETFILFDDAAASIKDSEGNTSRLRGIVPGSSGQRLYIRPYADMIAILKKGGLIQFSVRADSSTYRFDVENADFFERAYSQLE